MTTMALPFECFIELSVRERDKVVTLFSVTGQSSRVCDANGHLDSEQLKLPSEF